MTAKMNTYRSGLAVSPHDTEYLSTQVPKLREALTTLYELLEAYAPVWYIEEHHDKAEAALRFVKRNMSEK